MTHANTNPSATEVAKQFSTTKSQKVKAELVAYVEAKTKSSKRKRWGNLLKALKGNDTARINAYAATGDEARVAWAKVAKATPAKPKTTAKPKAKAKAKPKASQPNPLSDLASQVNGMDEKAFASFLNALVQLRK
tara:strand:- start:174 stop:578 length:405 start_codon:yes stop_codon:yes gene_type:complete